jgi:hypothetical protein
MMADYQNESFRSIFNHLSRCDTFYGVVAHFNARTITALRIIGAMALNLYRNVIVKYSAGKFHPIYHLSSPCFASRHNGSVTARGHGLEGNATTCPRASG